MTTPQILQFHVWLLDSEPPIWRRFEVSDQTTLDALHGVLQRVMGWKFSHLYDFKIGGDRYASPFPTPLEGSLDATQVLLVSLPLSNGTKFTYTYDFGDGWRHEITVADILPWRDDVRVPRCLEGDRACPPEDCGGVWGYEGLLERLADFEDPEYEELLDWIGVDFDSERFDVDAVNAQLQSA
jgi:hypothetical protein